MWDPAFRFAEVRRARVPGYARRFILEDTFGAAAPARRPALQAALDIGDGCDGLAFRIAAADDRGGDRLHLAPRALRARPTARSSSPPPPPPARSRPWRWSPTTPRRSIRPDLTRAEQVRYLATGAGMLGTSLAYIENLAAQFAALGIEDPEVDEPPRRGARLRRPAG